MPMATKPRFFLFMPAKPTWLLSGAIALSLMGCESLPQILPDLPLPTSFPIQSPSASPSAPSAAVPSPAIAEMETTVQQRINEIRQEQGLKPLKNNARLAQVARNYSRLMAEKNFFSHTGPDGRNVGQRVQAAGIVYWIVGENLFKSVNIPSPAPVAVRGWMKSPGHRENILNAKYSETGVGVWRQGNSYYFTQLFLRPPSLPALFE
ncbi:MAG TPA: CAP domain-containing protein [Allocoleopsis sp.]